jgi:hypothetical protein
MVGGDLHWIWEPYGIYQDIDFVSPPSKSLNLDDALVYIFILHGIGIWFESPRRKQRVHQRTV